ncbi:hypothetical protein VSF3289_04807 [Vibrio scophthalmi]|uniref:Uncharacterized protein n=1 Tax=Vibrio scophthalmi TaxID=45658 RepID=A0A1E3WIP1_9VIBR|nr:hypothetical protein VSF3289_04807 [Vibrio scophthalmi]
MIVWSIAGLLIFFATQFFTPAKATPLKQAACALMSCLLGPLMIVAFVGSLTNTNICLKHSISA